MSNEIKRYKMVDPDGQIEPAENGRLMYFADHVMSEARLLTGTSALTVESLSKEIAQLRKELRLAKYDLENARVVVRERKLFAERDAASRDQTWLSKIEPLMDSVREMVGEFSRKDEEGKGWVTGVPSDPERGAYAVKKVHLQYSTLKATFISEVSPSCTLPDYLYADDPVDGQETRKGESNE